jgi:hypothetical protein
LYTIKFFNKYYWPRNSLTDITGQGILQQILLAKGCIPWNSSTDITGQVLPVVFEIVDVVFIARETKK